MKRIICLVLAVVMITAMFCGCAAKRELFDVNLSKHLTLADYKNIEVDKENIAEDKKTYSGTVSALSSAVIDGNTNYFIMLEGNEKVFILPASLSEKLPFLKVGDSIEIVESTDKYISVTIK